MNAHDVLRSTMNGSMMVINKYVGDLSDADLMRRPGLGCNHIAWQLGHLIASEFELLESISPGASKVLPEGFAEKHSTQTCSENDPTKFYSKQEYLDLFEQVRAKTLEALGRMSESDLDRPAPEFLRSMFPTVGNVFGLIAVHPTMHAGQFVPVRRALDKPIVI